MSVMVLSETIRVLVEERNGVVDENDMFRLMWLCVGVRDFGS